MKKQYDIKTASTNGANAFETSLTIDFGKDNVSGWLADLAAKTIIIKLQAQWRAGIKAGEFQPPTAVTVKAEEFKPRQATSKVDKAKKLGMTKEQVQALLDSME